jgi:hypothetical protein
VSLREPCIMRGVYRRFNFSEKVPRDVMAAQ